MSIVLVVEDDVFINMEAIFIVKELGHGRLCCTNREGFPA